MVSDVSNLERELVREGMLNAQGPVADVGSFVIVVHREEGAGPWILNGVRVRGCSGRRRAVAAL